MAHRFKVGIFPASSALGRSLTKHLLKLIPPEQIILIGRYPDKFPEEYISQGVQVRKASYEDSSEHFYDIFQGTVDVLFLVSYPSFQDKLRVEVSNRNLLQALS